MKAEVKLRTNAINLKQYTNIMGFRENILVFCSVLFCSVLFCSTLLYSILLSFQTHLLPLGDAGQADGVILLRAHPEGLPLHLVHLAVVGELPVVQRSHGVHVDLVLHLFAIVEEEGAMVPIRICR